MSDSAPDSRQRPYDLVLHGATGFVGRLTAAHLAANAGSARVALSGRSPAKLERLRDELRVDWPLLVTDAASADDVAALAQSATAVASTVGPYAKYGMPLVRACAAAGTAYADLCGEVLFVRDSIDAVEEQARHTGARIVHACGFDSVPSDLGVLLLHQQVAADGAGSLEDTLLVVRSVRAGISGGTIDSLRTQQDEVKAHPDRRRVVSDPYALSPDRDIEPRSGSGRDLPPPHREPLVDAWVAPFVMAPFNSRIVRRSNALLGHAYGPAFRYHEVLGVGRGAFAPVRAGAVTAGLAALSGGMSFPPTRWVLDRLLPEPGSGPSERTRRTGHFRIEVIGTTSTGARYTATVAAKGDPGYAATVAV